MANSSQIVFISYRRDDSGPYAGRLCDFLAEQMGKDRVFMDIYNIAPGQDFVAAIERSVASCGRMLVVMGPHWAETLAERRKAGGVDYVAYEIAAALRLEKTVVPVLVAGASVRELAGLPPELEALSSHQAVELRDNHWQQDCQSLFDTLGRPRRHANLVVGALALVVLAVAIWLASGPFLESRRNATKAAQLATTARIQLGQGEYQNAADSYGEALKLTPRDRALQDAQVDAAMQWAEHFSVLTPEGGSPEALAAPLLAKMLKVLDAGLANAQAGSKRAADILAHLGWAHWLNQKIAYKEFGATAEDDLRQALKWDPKNVYANAMLGNMLLQKRSSTGEALAHLRVAEQSGQERKLVRTMELGGMHYDEDPQVEAAMIQVANNMRKSGETLDDTYLGDLISKFDLHDRDQMSLTARAVPPEDAWATYQWLLNSQHGNDPGLQADMRSEFVHASILEANGKQAEALPIFRDVQQKSRQPSAHGFLDNESAEAIARVQKVQ